MRKFNGHELVSDISSKPEIVAEEMFELFLNHDGTSRDIEEKAKENRDAFNMSFESDQEREQFMAALKSKLDSYSRQNSIYYGLKSQLSDPNFEMRHLGSRTVYGYISLFLKNQTTDFANTIRNVAIQITQDELTASKSDEIEAYIGDSKSRRLENEINKFLLAEDRAQIQTEIVQSKAFEHLDRLGHQVRNGEITKSEWVKKRKLIELEIYSTDLNQEAHTHFTNYQVLAREYQLTGNKSKKREYFDQDHEYRLAMLELRKVNCELDRDSGSLEPQEYSEELQEINEEIARENKRYSNIISRFFSEKKEDDNFGEPVPESEGRPR